MKQTAILQKKLFQSCLEESRQSSSHIVVEEIDGGYPFGLIIALGLINTVLAQICGFECVLRESVNPKSAVLSVFSKNKDFEYVLKGFFLGLICSKLDVCIE